MNFDNLFQNSGTQPTKTTQTNSNSTSTSTSTSTSSQNILGGLEQSLISDGETILEHAAVGVVAGLL